MMADTDPGRDPLPEDSRVSSLEERLKAAEQAEAVRTGVKGQKGADESYRLGNRVLAELIGGIVGGALIGWVLDYWFDTGHLLLVVVMGLGIVAAFWNIIKLSMGRPDK